MGRLAVKRLRAIVVATCIGAVVAAAAAAHAQTETMAKDLREEVVRVDVAVKDFYGRDERRPMPITIYRPDGPGPFPFVVFQHGRPPTERRASQGRSRPEALARHLVASGFVVLAPTRVGYWETYGDFDPESTGSCSDLRLGGMAQAAADETLATVAFAKTLPYVDASRWVVAGVSVGGLMSVVTVGLEPEGLVGGINFAGGAGGRPETEPGRSCSPHRVETLYRASAAQAAVPMLWMYWENDRYCGASVPHEWFAAWKKAGGRGELRTFPARGEDGHAGVNIDMDHWVPAVDGFLASLGFAMANEDARAAATGFATIDDVARVPARGEGAAAAYRRFLDAKGPRAFAVGDRGAYGLATNDFVAARALGFCARSGQRCALYAIDGDVVWPGIAK